VGFEPGLLRECEFAAEAHPFRFLDVDGRWQEQPVPARGLAYTWCQVPIVYRLVDRGPPALTVTLADGSSQTLAALSLPAAISDELVRRSGRVRGLSLDVPRELLLRPDGAAAGG
jgi:hypothetical protein